jgi:hypothetical protein
MTASVGVLAAKTELLLASKVATILRLGDIVMRPGDVPVLKADTRAKVSFAPSMKTSLPVKKVELTPCEAKTRFFKPLGGFLGLL